MALNILACTLTFSQLAQFLRDKNPQVRQIALSNLLPQTPKGSPHRDIFYAGVQSGGLQGKKDNDIIRDIKILCRDQLVCPTVNFKGHSLIARPMAGYCTRRLPGSREPHR